MTYKDTNGKEVEILRGDVLRLKDGSKGTVLRVNTDLNIVNATAVILHESGEQLIVTEKDVQEIISFVFSIVRFFKMLFGKKDNVNEL